MLNQKIKNLKSWQNRFWWIFQSTGMIDHYNKGKQLGNQPIRVTHNVMLYLFIHDDNEFKKKIIDAVLSKGMNPQVSIIYGDIPLLGDDGKLCTPSVDKNKKIDVHETYLSYTWIMTYVLFILYVETIDHPRLNDKLGFEVKKINHDEITRARDLFDYGKSLIVDFQEWDKSKLPNPEIYNAEKRDYPEQTNMYYVEAVRFALIHEFVHITKHIDKLKPEQSDEEILKMEIEADEESINIIMEGMEPGREIVYECGVVMGILSMFFVRYSTKGRKHPNLEERLVFAINKLNIKSDHQAYGMACIGLKLWNEQFGHNLRTNEKLSDKEQFDNLIEQIREMNKD